MIRKDLSPDAAESVFPGTYGPKDGGVLYQNRELRKAFRAPTNPPVSQEEQSAGQVNALRIDFVASPGNSIDLASDLAELLEHAGLYQEGLRASMLLVSDREARLVTLLVLWDGERFQAARERLTAWTLKLVSRFADGPPRAYTSLASFLLPQASAKLTLSDLRPDEMAELVALVAAG